MTGISNFALDTNNLDFLSEVAADFQILGLGEATHGNREFHLVRSDFSKFLIKKSDFKGVIMEFPFSKSENLNSYIKAGRGNLKQLMLNLGYWTVATEEIKSFISWLRNYNLKNRNNQVSIYGNDVELNNKIRLKPGKFRDEWMANKTFEIAGSNKFVVWSHNHHISRHYGGGFTSMGYYLSKKVKYFPIATLFYKGYLNAMEFDSKSSVWGSVKKFKIKKAEKDSIEARLAKENCDKFFLNMKNLPFELKGQFENAKARFLGAGFDPKDTSSMFQEMPFIKMFDALIYIMNVTPSKLIK